MDRTVGILLIIGGILYSAYAYVTEGFVYDTKFYLQISAISLGSVYILWDSIKATFKHLLEMTKPSKNSEPEDKPDHSYCQKDFESLMYLKSRSKSVGSKEALDLVVKLNNILFCGKDE